jgi:DNA primase
MNIKKQIASVNLVTLFEKTVGAPVRRGRWLLFRCPCHADRHPSLGIAPNRDHWQCFGRCNTAGDAIDWLRLRQGLTFSQACVELEKLAGQLPALPDRKPTPVPIEGEPPQIGWQKAARHIVERCEGALWSPVGARALAWLYARGLTAATLYYWRIGFNPMPRKLNGVFVPRGIVIPCFERGQLWSLKIRRAQGVPKYVHVAGSRPALFGAHTLVRLPAAVITEGEFDAMLLHQYASNLAGVITLGSATTRLANTWLRELLPVPVLLAAYDADAAGQRGATAWQALTKRVHIVRLPMGKDMTEFAQLGGDLHQWAQFVLGGINVSGAMPSPNSLPTPVLGIGPFNSPTKLACNSDGSECLDDASVLGSCTAYSSVNSPMPEAKEVQDAKDESE